MRFFLLFAVLLAPLAARAEKANTILIHPGDVLYAQFSPRGSSLRLVSISKEKNNAAQVTFTMKRLDDKKLTTLTVENRLERDLLYKAEARFFRKDNTPLKHPIPVVPVVGGKVAFESWPVPVDELAMFGFELDR